MPPQRHYYVVKSAYLPNALFADLRAACEAPAFKPAQPTFEFDWIRRRIEIIADDRPAAEAVLAQLIAAVNRGAGPGMLLPGAPHPTPEGRTAIPIGVLLQTPDIFAEILVHALEDFGIRGVRPEQDGDGFSVPINAMNRALSYADALQGFPLPPYLTVDDQGVR